jgi:hypothetical protein
MANTGSASSIIGRASRSAVGRATGRLSRAFAKSSAFQSTGRFFRRQFWAWPIVAACLFGAVGWWVSESVEAAMNDQRAVDLNTMVDASVSALRIWTDEQKNNALLIAGDQQLRPWVEELLKHGDEKALLFAPAQSSLRGWITEKSKVGGYTGFFVVAPDGTVVAADQDAPVGKAVTEYRREVFDQANAGNAVVTKPYRSRFLLQDEDGELRAGLPTMFAIAPIRDARGAPIAALGMRIRPDNQFTRILQVVRFGRTGETYAFDRNGLLLSQSRFDDNLKQIGLLADQPDARSILTVELRDPQVNMVAGERPRLRRADQPLTRLAESATKGESGFDAEGYRDYRGSLSVGAWRWLDDYDFGVATEVDTAEAFRPVYILRRAYRVLLALLLLSAIGIFLATLYIARQQKALQLATLTARKLGQYSLETKLGSGGMGTVYKARHAMLRRPTAVKLLDLERMNDAAIARFEREVQLTSSLTHPNTVSVFDYGRTPEGICYYAMEYLEGLNLDDLVKRHGPIGEARLAYILRQVCGSLAEAHAAGMVHRDIKPANLFLTQRGGQYDFVKVLDFGLVKEIDGSGQAGLTNPDTVAGTPLYMAPEALTKSSEVDARTDVYALGAVAYYLLTGQPVFTGSTVTEICMKHVREEPEPPSRRLGRPLTPELEALILRCLAKAPADRPKDASDLWNALDACPLNGTWTRADAEIWWTTLKTESPPPPGMDAAPATDETVVRATPPAPERTHLFGKKGAKPS